MNMYSKWCGLVVLMAAWSVAFARPFTATDLVSVREIGRVALSPDERWLVWEQRETELVSNQIRSRLWLLDLQVPDDTPRPLTPVGDHDARLPSFSIDGASIYFLSDASGTEQLWRVPTQGGAAQQISHFDVALKGYSLSPTGEQVALWADVSTACNELPCKFPQPVASCCGTGRSFEDAYVQRQSEWRSRQTRAMIYVPHRDEWMMPEVRSRVYVMSVNGGKATSAMDRWLGDAGAEQIAWSVDGKNLFFALRQAGPAERFALNLDVVASGTDASFSANLTSSNAGIDTLPATSPDGKWLAYVSAQSTNDMARRTLQLRNLATGAVKSIAEDWNASVRSIAWEADSRGLLVTARVGMDEPLFRVSLDQGKVTRLTAEGRAANVVPVAQGGAILTLDSLLSPPDLYRVASDGELRRLTAINANHLSDIDLPRRERFDFEGANGATVSAWMIAPESRSDRLPTVLLIHDGTHGEPANGWSRRWNPVLFSAPGYVVIGIDFRVTGGHGTAERDALVLDDLRLGMSAAADRFSLDPAKVCIAGNGAYGGYLVYLIAGQAKGQSQCLIANGSVVDATTQSYQTDEPWMHDWQPASAEVDIANPLHQAWAWRTPVLILHGEKDFRVPYTQAVAAFTAAQRYNVPSRLVVFPDEGTWMQAPKNTIQWYGEVLNWLDRWLTDARLPIARRRFMP